MAWRGEVEDGLGWGGLVASKSEQREEARLAALERDAARYRWLREHWHNLCTATGIDTHGNYCVTEIFVGPGEHAPFADGTLEAAIDAVMREQGANAR